MYKVVYTKGNEEKTIAEYEDKNKALAHAKQLQSETSALITVEKNGRIY